MRIEDMITQDESNDNGFTITVTNIKPYLVMT